MEALDSARAALPKSKLGKTLKYLFNQRAPHSVFLEEAQVPIHNNDAERGGEVACWLYSLVLSYRQDDVDPEAYLADVLMAAATTQASEIASLTPWAWGEQNRTD